jgi:hypothetical protein
MKFQKQFGSNRVKDENEKMAESVDDEKEDLKVN